MSDISSAGLIATEETGELRDFFALLKPRVMSLVVFTALAGMVAAPGHLNPVLAATAILCIAIGAGASGAINMWYERRIDGLMERTRDRPLPAGRIDPDAALAFGVFLAVAAVLMMGLAVNVVAAAWLAGSIAFYVFVYTIWLKPLTPYNIVIGGAAGAIPPVIGWSAVTGDAGLAAWSLFALIFVWTPPHSWALALFRRDDYLRAGVPMLPVVAGVAATKRQIMAYALLLAPVGVLPALLGIAGRAYGATAIVLGALFVLSAWRLMRADERNLHRMAKQLFAYSILYVLLLFAALLVGAAGFQWL